jgi:hypothetical protein
LKIEVSTNLSCKNDELISHLRHRFVTGFFYALDGDNHRRRKGMKKTSGILLGSMLAIGISVILPRAYSSSVEDSLAQLSGQDPAIIEAQLDEGAHPSELAQSYNIVEAFKAQRAEHRVAMIQKRLEKGNLSEADAEALRAQWQNRTEDCDGSPNPLRVERAMGQQKGRP